MTSNEIKNTNDSDSKKKNVSKTIQQENQAKVFLKSIRVSPIKLNLVVSPIRGEKVEKAISYVFYFLFFKKFNIMVENKLSFFFK